jgi:hypothetical protein
VKWRWVISWARFYFVASNVCMIPRYLNFLNNVSTYSIHGIMYIISREKLKSWPWNESSPFQIKWRRSYSQRATSIGTALATRKYNVSLLFFRLSPLLDIVLVIFKEKLLNWSLRFRLVSNRSPWYTNYLVAPSCKLFVSNWSFCPIPYKFRPFF